MKTDNELIAEFMGMKLYSLEHEEGTDHSWTNCPEGQHWAFETPPHFDRSWDWLMPVVQKIDRLNFSTSIAWSGHASKDANITVIAERDYTIITQVSHGNKLSSVYQAIVEFVKYYNSVTGKELVASI